MQNRDAEHALWWVASAGGFIAWQVGAWLIARGRWQRAKKAGRDAPEPAFLGAMADWLGSVMADFGEIMKSALPLLCGVAWGGAVLGLIGLPLVDAYGLVAALAGGALVYAAGAVPFCMALQRLGKRRR